MLITRCVMLLFPVLLFSCGSNRNDNMPPDGDHALLNELLSLYEPVKSEDTIFVFSANNPEETNYRYRGFALDSAYFRVFPEPLRQDGWSSYACARFELDSSFTGLITRGPGEYISSKLFLLIYDKHKGAIVSNFELAEYFGDAGLVVDKSSKLYRKGNSWLCQKRIIYMESNPEDPNDTVPEERMEDCLTRVFPGPVDTLKKTVYANAKYNLGQTVTLSGLLKTEPFWGPPGYGEDTTVDSRETVYMLLTEKAIDVNYPKIAHAVRNIRKIQVIFTEGMEMYKDKKVSVKGDLFEAVSGHHHTPVLVDAKTIKPR